MFHNRSIESSLFFIGEGVQELFVISLLYSTLHVYTLKLKIMDAHIKKHNDLNISCKKESCL